MITTNETTIQGKVTNIRFYKQADGFAIFELYQEDSERTTVLKDEKPQAPDADVFADLHKFIWVKGSLVGSTLVEGMELRCTGVYKTDPKWGKQFQASRIVTVVDSQSGIERFLAHSVYGIGPVRARKLKDFFGSELVDVITNHPERLVEVAWLTEDMRTAIVTEWEKGKHSRALTVFLYDYGLTPGQVKSVIEKFGASELTVALIKSNPYVLTQVSRIGFKTADKVALAMGLPPDSPQRMRAAIMHLLFEVITMRGHLYCGRDDLKNMVEHIVPYKEETFQQSLAELEAEALIVHERGAYYTLENYQQESRSAEYLAKMLQPIDLPVELETFIEKYQADHGITLSSKQKDIIRLIPKNQVIICTGLPGTGKTTVTKAIVTLFEQHRVNYRLLTPTGISAQRVYEATGREAMTIHRALGYNGSEWGFHSENKLITQAVIVDEVSMVDQHLFYRLLDALPLECVLILVGDRDQLPSVGAGNVLRDLIRSEVVPTVHLTEIFRQAQESGIVMNAHKVNRGELIDLDNKYKDFTVVALKDEDKIHKAVMDFVKNLHGKGKKIQVLSPRYNGLLGVDGLNEEIRTVMNPNNGQTEIAIGTKKFRLGDRVLNWRNNYDKEIFNGNIGNLIAIDLKERKLQVVFPMGQGQNAVMFTAEEAMDALTLAYCKTVHKSQGNEYDYVILPVHKSYTIQLQRNLLYTAMTRAKRHLIIIGDPNAIYAAIKNDKEQRRNTRLGERLRDNLKAMVPLQPRVIRGLAPELPGTGNPKPSGTSMQKALDEWLADVRRDPFVVSDEDIPF